MMLSKPYMRLREAFPVSAFTLAEAQKVMGATSGSAKVIISRLKHAGQIVRLERGKYRLIRPESQVRLQELEQKNPKFYRLALEIYRKHPNLEMLALYGSQLTGRADRYSDYDALLVLPEVLNVGEKKSLKQELEKKRGIRLHLIVCSEKTYRAMLLIEPYLKFWLNEAIILDEAGVSSTSLPPTAKFGYLEALRTAEVYFEIAEAGSPRRASYYITALKIALMLDHALKLDYEFKNVRSDLEKLVAADLLLAVRENPVSPRKVSMKHVRELREATKRKLKEVRTKLHLLGQNESDLYWRSKLEVRHR